MATQQFFVSNFRETLSILESLRVGKTPGRGMRHLAPRPIIEDALRASETDLITNGRDGEFPTLLEVADRTKIERQGQQAATVPLASIHRVVFQSEAHRDIALHRTFENASFEQMQLAVDAALFGASGDARFSKSDTTSSEGENGWLRADWVCGGLAAALEAFHMHPASNKLSAPEFFNNQPGIDLLVALDQGSSENAKLDLLVEFFSRHSGSGDLYGEDLLDRSLVALAKGGKDGSVLEAFEKRMRAILASDIARRPGELTDEGDIVLRALSILVQRPTTAEVLEDRVAKEFPGPQVFMTAALLSGAREGLARLPWTMKSRYMELLGEIGSFIENDPVISLQIADILAASNSSGNPDAVEVTPNDDNNETSTQADKSRALNFEICKLSSRAAVGRALLGLNDKPSTWRIVCDEAEMLHLTIFLTEDDDPTGIEKEATKAIRSWKKRAPSVKKARHKKQPLDGDSDTLPGLLDQQEK